MRTISKAFIREQQKNRSKGISWKLKASAENETKDLTTYLCRESLSRIEWRLENDLTSFVNSDFQCSLWYDEELWDWLNIHDKILVEILCGFDFEKIQVFWGYID
ncbi:MAG TPA: hypothetical protein ENI52_04035, partial [Thermoplasmata archaeon]|nr:hypothetical protein [Thermoplasmata archaeon]